MIIIDCSRVTPTKPILFKVKINGNKYIKRISNHTKYNTLISSKPLTIHKGIDFSIDKLDKYISDTFLIMAHHCYKHSIIFSIYTIDQDRFNKYKREIDTLTKRNKSLLLSKWDGYDYYDGKYILKNFLLSSNNNMYPTIDHKISIMDGFINNIPAEDIGSIKNLCITTKRHNSIKQSMSSKEYKNIIRNINP